MDILLIIVAIVLLLCGLIGCIAPVIPGPPIAYIGLLLLQFTHYHPFSVTFLVIVGLITAAITILDFIIPSLGTKYFGGSKWGKWGSIIGIVLGLFIIPPYGIFLMPFVCSFIAELLYGKKTDKALYAAWGSFVGFLAGTLMKVLLCLAMIGAFIYGLLF